MARKRKGRPLDGVLLLEKPAGVSSNFALQKVRWLFQAEKAGHGGTLDPFAEGLLPVLFGEAAKFGQYVLGADKRYTVTVQFGAQTDTDDREGEVIDQARLPDMENTDWTALCAQFLGAQMQMPPIYSALKVGGKRAYDLARMGQMPALEPRPVVFHEINVLEVRPAEGQLVLGVLCSKGTYIRALARDLGSAAGSAAFASRLIRTGVGRFSASAGTPQSLEALKEAQGMEAIDALLLPLTACVQDLPAHTVPAEKMRFIRNGNDIETALADGLYALYDGADDDERFFGTGRAAAGRLFPGRLCALPQPQG